MNSTIRNLSDELVQTSMHLSCPEHDVVANLSLTARRFYFTLSVVSVLAALVTVLANVLFIVVMINHRRELTTGQKMLLILSGVDLMQGLAKWPIKAALHHWQSHGNTDCVLMKALFGTAYVLTWATVVAIFLITLEQYIAIAFPFLHRRSITFSKMVRAFLGCSILNVIACVVVNLGLNKKRYWQIYNVSLATAVLTLAVAIIALQGHVAYIALYRSKRVGQQNLAKRMALRRRARAIKISLTIILTFFLAYSPFAAYQLYKTTGKSDSSVVTIYLQSIAMSFTSLNSTVNPFVYYSRSQFVRMAVKKLLANAYREINPKKVQLRSSSVCSSKNFVAMKTDIEMSVPKETFDRRDRAFSC